MLVVFVVPNLRIMNLLVRYGVGNRCYFAVNSFAENDKSELLHKIAVGAYREILRGIRKIAHRVKKTSRQHSVFKIVEAVLCQRSA